uniref:E3 ubiquitin-protein ligase TRIM39-like n=1 Tax=Geotrypetes seraphini TaxID=260995 RepID=A0A6P8NT33_GEOSA|nr:E3 ubiquitin-protein ligase TRIM39-like [Geotrypetes seraphini]
MDVTLDPKTAHPQIILSDDQKSLELGELKQDLPDSPERFDIEKCVLGCENFTSGRHYWEVEVGNITHWRLGVCKDSVRRKEAFQMLSPEEGYWTMQLWDIGKYSALTVPNIPVFSKERPQVLGIFLDYEEGKVSFYNVDNESHLYTFISTITGTLRPFFFLSYGVLKIHPVPAWESESQAQV